MTVDYPEIQLKRVYDAADKADGYRVLADRVWPRGIKKVDLQHDIWLREICPPTELRKAWHNQEIDYATFKQRYLEALVDNEDAQAALQDLSKKSMLTLLTAAKNPQKGHLAVLRQVIMQLATGKDYTRSSAVCYLDSEAD